MRKAIVRNSVVENIAVDPSPSWTPPVGTSAVDDINNEAQIGGSFSAGVFSPAPPPPDVNPVDFVDVAILKVSFNHENRIRTLEGKVALTVAQFKAAWRSLL